MGIDAISSLQTRRWLHNWHLSAPKDRGYSTETTALSDSRKRPHERDIRSVIGASAKITNASGRRDLLAKCLPFLSFTRQILRRDTTPLTRLEKLKRVHWHTHLTFDPRTELGLRKRDPTPQWSGPVDRKTGPPLSTGPLLILMLNPTIPVRFLSPTEPKHKTFQDCSWGLYLCDEVKNLIWK